MRRTTVMALVAWLVTAATATAAPERTIEVGAARPLQEFDATLTDFNGASPATDYCSAGTCDETLIKIGDGGRLTFASKSDGSPVSEIDLVLWRSDAAGARAARLATAITDGPDEKVSALVKPGYYLVSASGYPAVGASFHAVVRLEALAPVAPVVAPVPLPAAAKTAPAPKSKPSCKQRARRIKNSRKRKAALRKCARPARKR